MEPSMWKRRCRGTKNNANWKAPGRDQIADFWLKQLSATYKNLAAQID